MLGYVDANGDKKAKVISLDHKPSDVEERERIVGSGGRVFAARDEDGSPIGPERVWLGDRDLPGLAVARSMGDALAATVGVRFDTRTTYCEEPAEDLLAGYGAALNPCA